MKAEYIDVWYTDGAEIVGSPKTVALPFKRICARALIIRRKDGAILGTLHREGGQYALPGGSIEDGESTLQAAQRELEEENIALENPAWDTKVVVDYFDGYKELSVWHLVVVDDARIGESEENIDSRWFSQDEAVWYPFMHENLILTINRYFPDLAHTTTLVRKG
jgi:8-oxo-dGTP pyrophosphatase MutT (NUDIX family)